jgi:hypothetical protein
MRCSQLTLATILLPCALSAGTADEAKQIASEAVARQTGASLASITVESASPAEWAGPDLGCGLSASASTPEPVQGYRVLLRDGSKLHVVHVADARAVVCSSGLAAAAPPRETSAMDAETTPEPTDPPSRALVAQARTDLSQRLSVAPDDIKFIQFKAVVWPDSSFGCPRPGMVYTQVQRDGVLIRFEVNGRRFDYHGGAGRAPFLCERADESPPNV